MSISPNKILIVDDNEQIRDLLKILCSRCDFNAKCLTNGQEAVKALEHENFKMILMDLDMPIMGGLQATRVIHQCEKEINCKRIPIVGISGTIVPEPHRTCLEAGMDGFISKPIVPREMFDVIKSVIAL